MPSADPMPLRSLRSHPSPLYRLPGTALVLIACAVAILLTASLTAAFAWRDRQESVRQATAVAGNVGLLVAEHATRMLETAGTVLTQAAAIAGSDLAGPDLAGPGIAEPTDRVPPSGQVTRERLRRLAASVPAVAFIEIRDRQGTPVVSTRDAPSPSARDLPLGSGGPMAVTELDGKRLVLLQRPLPGADGSLGNIAVALSAEHLRNIYHGFDIGYGHTIAVKAADGTVLVRDPEGSGTGGNPAMDTDIRVSRPVGQPAEQAALGDGLTAEVTIATSSILKRWRDQLWTYAAYALAAIATVMVIGALAIERARRERQAEDALQHAYDTLEEHVHHRTAELENANGQLASALSDKEILLKEVQHRVKNNLQVICSLLRLQAARIDEQARRGFEESLRRIQSLSLLHELLYRAEQPARIDLADYLRQLCDGLVRSENPTGAKLVVEAQEWIVDVDQATPLALIASELVSNALLHAFPDGHAGTVTVRLDKVPEGGMRLTIRDDGVGLPPGLPGSGPMGRAEGTKRRGATSGLGLVLVQALATQAGGKLQIDRSQGTAFLLALPAPAERRTQAAA